MNLVDELKNDARGLAILADWLGDGLTPVSQELADKRASVCLTGNDGKECPHLTHPRWWESAKDVVADTIKEQMVAKSGMHLETKLDAVPRMCNVCGCCTALKVWTPTKHIAAHTSDELAKKFTPYCWVRHEVENL